MRKKRIPYLLSFAFHLLLALIFFLIKISLDSIEDDFVTIGFGTFGKSSMAGVFAKNQNDELQKVQPEAEEIVKEEIVKKVEVPKTKSSDETNKVVVNKSKEENKEKTSPRKIEPVIKDETESGKGKEETGEGEGNFGFEIDFGGKGLRKIYSYTLPSYPEGVFKEIDVKLKFSILSDGTVGKILPLIKADARLEFAAITSLRQWRFEPLPDNQKNIEQQAIIIFPFRLQ